MKHYKSINKIYYDVVLNSEKDERPFFIMNNENEFIVFKDRYNIINSFKDFNTAKKYVDLNYSYPHIIIINFNQKD